MKNRQRKHLKVGRVTGYAALNVEKTSVEIFLLRKFIICEKALLLFFPDGGLNHEGSL